MPFPQGSNEKQHRPGDGHFYGLFKHGAFFHSTEHKLLLHKCIIIFNIPSV